MLNLSKIPVMWPVSVKEEVHQCLTYMMYIFPYYIPKIIMTNRLMEKIIDRFVNNQKNH